MDQQKQQKRLTKSHKNTDFNYKKKLTLTFNI